MAKKKKAGMTAMSWIMLAVMAVGLVLSVVGIFTDWIEVKTFLGDKELTNSPMTLDDLREEQETRKDFSEDAAIEYFDIMLVCVLVTLIAVAAAFVLFLLGGLLKIKLLKSIGMIAGIVAILGAVLTLIFSIMMCKNYVSVDGGDLGGIETVMAVGCYLTMIGGIVGGAGAVISGAKK